MRYKVMLSYDGSCFYGFQVQNEKRTVEKEIVDALKIITGNEIKIYPSGRTDRYVHAKCQVIHFDLDNDIPTNRLKTALNNILNDDIHVINIEVASNEFHARFSALKKEYRYYINLGEKDPFLTRYETFINNLDVNKMSEAIKLFIGTHDFKGFASAQIDKRKDTIKTIFDAKINILDNNKLEFVFIGTGFLKYQVRRMMGALIEIGKNRMSLDTINLILETKDTKICHKVAPGCGLYLYNVVY